MKEDKANKTLTTSAADISTLPTVSMPVHIACGMEKSPLLYVSMPQIDQIAVLDPATDQWLTPIKVPSYPGYIDLIPSRNLLITANFNDESLSFINLDTRIPITLPIGRYPRTFAVSPDTTTVASANFHVGTVTVLAIGSEGAVETGRIKVGPRPVSIVFFGDSVTAAIVDQEDWSVTIVDCQNAKVLARNNKLPSQPRALATTTRADEAYIILPKESCVCVVDSTGRTLTTLNTGDNPMFLKRLSDGNRLAVVNSRGDSVTFIDGLSRKVISTVPVGPRPISATELPAEQLLLVINRGDDSVSLIDTHSYAVVDHIRVGGSAYRAALDPTRHAVYITNEGTCSLSVLRL